MASSQAASTEPDPADGRSVEAGPVGAPADPLGTPDPLPLSAGDDNDEPDRADESGGEEDSLLERVRQLADSTDGTAADDGIVQRIDRVEAFNQAIVAIRWITTMACVSLVIAAAADDRLALGFAGLLVAYSVVRTARPLRYYGDLRSLASILAEVALTVFVVATTGGWESPFIFALVNTAAIAGFARGFSFALRISAVSALGVTAAFIRPGVSGDVLRISAQWVLVLVLVALIAGYARRISGEADRQHSLALDRLGRLADANSLLFSLHRITQTLPASLDLDEALDSTITRLRGIVEFDFAAILLSDDSDASLWHVSRTEGGRMPRQFSTADLPPPLRSALADGGVISRSSLPSSGGPGIAKRASSGIYAPLPARGSTVGLLAVEHHQEGHFSSRDAELLRGFVDSVALAIDNARWFSRLRTVGADEERTRIARDLHDRIGQSLAYLAFELDRIVAAAERGESVEESLERLREDVRGVIREVRDTLYDLRTDVSDNEDLTAVLEAFTARVEERSDLKVDLVMDRDDRLPLLQEREMWRIAQEAITNIERHAAAKRVRVVWRCNGESAVLDITDDGQGFPVGRAGRLDSYGILGMRERASSIGASLDLASEPGKGTRVRCTLLREYPDEDATSAPGRMT